MIHTSAARWYYIDPETPQWQWLNAYDSLARFCVPIFFMISGALFLDPARNVTIRSILRRSLPRLVVAYIVWSGFFALYTTFAVTGYAGGWALLSLWATGHYHLWFLLALMALYLVTPLLRRLSESPVLARYFLVLAALFAVVLPMMSRVPRVGPIVDAVLETAQLQLVLGYSIYFVLGYLLHAGLFAGVRTLWLVLAGAAALVATVAGTSWLSIRAGTGDAWLYAYLTPNVVVMSAVVFLLAKRWGEKHPLSASASRLVGVFGGCSFGIYLVHPLFQDILQRVGVTSDMLPAAVSVPIVAFAILVPSFALAWLLQRIPRAGRYLA